MRTRKGGYPSLTDGITFSIRPAVSKICKRTMKDAPGRPCKQAATSRTRYFGACVIDTLPDDLLMAVILAVSSTASSPQDLINAMLTCRRFCAAATHPQVLANAAISAFAVKAESWSDGGHRFLKKCADAGNVEACYTLGMIWFYCLNSRVRGASLIAKAAMASHAPALHSLAVIQFNGSGGSRRDKDLKAGVNLCAKAASLGYVDAIRELGHCLQDGYGAAKNMPEGRRLLLEANAREAAAAMSACPHGFIEAALQMTGNTGVTNYHHQRRVAASQKSVAIQDAVLNQANVYGAIVEHSNLMFQLLQGGGCFLLSDFGCNVPSPKVHVANKFLVKWFSLHPLAPGLRLCSHVNCGRPETRRHEFRRCSACGSVHYCSRACQALDWKIRHKHDCNPHVIWENQQNNDLQDENLFAFDDV
ncbi:hypothetical protein O6H91_23G014800 [Diphasiastrum complanatum]|uniref:Uncharacterized protein n=2 Tax=Diphasiastrum complanatum TaxID=34168 RepID=A0ACC2A8C6_DIPCM|nr:hypothetical protein O6H91_Y392500 [Diphasiastrum complanatum]KAJ7276562.1 hypothetical protein O6H91_Y392500 [Diphasiastrum complanatum]KAJ7513798.1 hypothetical protein O6H91_23G014800 [Diphasiastrum complanatum]KAJ7513799.1 hypothetical protein O6H91_23G014800 [Diphasiastrum complanatum]